MDHNFDKSLEPAYPCKDDVAKVGPEELLEECWFFSNLLDRKARMLRTLSDPGTSSNYRPGKSYEETYESVKELSGHDKSRRSSLMRTPSMPPCIERKDSNPTTEGSDPGRRKSNSETSSGNLLRAPSLPTTMGAEEFQDEEIEFSMGKLIRQASLNTSGTMRPRTQAAKGVRASSNISRHQPRTKPELNSLKLEGLEKIRPHRLMSQLKTQKSLNDLEFEELQGFKDLGFDFSNKDLNPGIVSIIPGLQEKKRTEAEEERKTRRPYLSEAWQAQNSAPSVPKWGGKRSKEEEMKAQIKFWARAVASNVR